MECRTWMALDTQRKDAERRGVLAPGRSDKPGAFRCPRRNFAARTSSIPSGLPIPEQRVPQLEATTCFPASPYARPAALPDFRIGGPRTLSTSADTAPRSSSPAPCSPQRFGHGGRHVGSTTPVYWPLSGLERNTRRVDSSTSATTTAISSPTSKSSAPQGGRRSL